MAEFGVGGDGVPRRKIGTRGVVWRAGDGVPHSFLEPLSHIATCRLSKTTTYPTPRVEN